MQECDGSTAEGRGGTCICVLKNAGSQQAAQKRKQIPSRGSKAPRGINEEDYGASIDLTKTLIRLP